MPLFSAPSVINHAVPSTEFLDRHCDVFVVTDLDALGEISALKKKRMKKQLMHRKAVPEAGLWFQLRGRRREEGTEHIQMP